VLIWPAVPILALLGERMAYTRPEAAVRPSLMAIGCAVVLCGLLTAVARDLQRAALATSLLAFAFLSQSPLEDAAERVQIPSWLLVGPVPPALIAGLILFYGRRRLDQWTAFVNAFAALSAMLLAWPIGTSLAEVWSAPTNVYAPMTVRPDASASRPDIYILILDAYGRDDILREKLGVQSALVPYLRANGFTVPEQAASNYAQTAQSIASLLNLEYLTTLLARQPAIRHERWRLADHIAHNRTFRTLSSLGYRVRVYESEYGLLRMRDVDERRGPWLPVTDFDLGLFEQSIGPDLSALGGRPRGALMHAEHRRHVNWTLDRLESEVAAADEPPTVVFAHLLLPHPPFSFEPDGRPFESNMPALFNDGTHWVDVAVKSGVDESYQAGYARSIQYVDRRLQTIINRIVQRSNGRQAIVYLQGDHGPGSTLDWASAANTDARERFGILLAIRFPDGHTLSLAPSVTPVNAMRTVLNEAIGTDLTLLPDRSYFSPWNDPTEFIDVTARVQQAGR
jgi:hypothetical protein